MHSVSVRVFSSFVCFPFRFLLFDNMICFLIVVAAVVVLDCCWFRLGHLTYMMIFVLFFKIYVV